MERATLERVQQLQEAWADHPITNYEIVVEVEREDERRENQIRISGGRIIQAEVRYWDPGSGVWNGPARLNEDQAYPFTIPGLLETVEAELKFGKRQGIWIEPAEGPPLLEKIILEKVTGAGMPLKGTQATITVVKFEILDVPSSS